MLKPAKRTILVITFILLAVLAARIIWPYYETQVAMAEWESVGGGMTVAFSKYGFGPDQMSLGSMPGIGTSDNLTKLRNAAVRMNGTPGCRKLHLCQPTWSCDHLLFLVTPLKLDYLGLDQIALDQECVNDLSTLPNIQSIGIGSGPISADSIRYFLRSSPKRTMRVMRLAAAERAELRQEFGERISFE